MTNDAILQIFASSAAALGAAFILMSPAVAQQSVAKPEPNAEAVIGGPVPGLAGAVWADLNNDGRVDGYLHNNIYFEMAAVTQSSPSYLSEPQAPPSSAEETTPRAHQIEGALGYRLGAPAPNQVRSCEISGGDKTGPGLRRHSCPAGDFFSSVFVKSERDILTGISAVRSYLGADLKKASDDCNVDFKSLRSVLARRYPRLIVVNLPNRPQALKLTETVRDGVPVGRTLELSCDPLHTSADKTVQTGVSLWLHYSQSFDEWSRLRALEKADALKEKGLNPENL